MTWVSYLTSLRKKSIMQSLVTQSVILDCCIYISGNLLELQNLMPQLRPIETESAF